MKNVTMRTLQEEIDIDAVERAARKEWEATQRRRRRVEQWIVKLIPFGVVLMTGIFYMLSAPHTAQLLNLITPGFGNLSPLGFELGIIITAALIEGGWKNTLSKAMLTLLLFLSVIINIAGAFIAVVTLATGVELSRDTVTQLINRFSSLPATYQVVLILVPFVGATIPIMAKLTGEVVIKMAMGKIVLERESNDQVWAREALKVMHGALLQAAMKKGAGIKTAGNWSRSIVDQMYSYKEPEKSKQTTKATGQPLVTPQLSGQAPMGFKAHLEATGQSQTVPNSLEIHRMSQADDEGYEEKDLRDGLVPRLSKKHVRRWMEEHPEHQYRSDREISRLYMHETFGVDSETGYKTVQRVKKDMGIE